MFVIACGTGGCEKDTFHDTGLANGVYDGTAWEYMQAGHGNWDSLVIMIRKAGLADLFDGKDPDCPQMTVFGLTNLSIVQFLLRTTDGEGWFTARWRICRMHCAGRFCCRM